VASVEGTAACVALGPRVLVVVEDAAVNGVSKEVLALRWLEAAEDGAEFDGWAGPSGCCWEGGRGDEAELCCHKLSTYSTARS
jgi:hypothetical protein